MLSLQTRLSEAPSAEARIERGNEQRTADRRHHEAEREPRGDHVSVLSSGATRPRRARRPNVRPERAPPPARPLAPPTVAAATEVRDRNACHVLIQGLWAVQMLMERPCARCRRHYPRRRSSRPPPRPRRSRPLAVLIGRSLCSRPCLRPRVATRSARLLCAIAACSAARRRPRTLAPGRRTERLSSRRVPPRTGNALGLSRRRSRSARASSRQPTTALVERARSGPPRRAATRRARDPRRVGPQSRRGLGRGLDQPERADPSTTACERPTYLRVQLSIAAGHEADGVPRPEFSRRARARFRSTRRSGRSVATESRPSSSGCCAHARAFAERIAPLPGAEVLNEVVLNQVLFRFADDATTTAALGGRAGRRRGVDERHDLGRATRDPALGLGWRTTEDDIERTVAAFRARSRSGLQCPTEVRHRQHQSSRSVLGGRLRGRVGDLARRPPGRRASSCRRAAGSRPRRAAGGA